MLSAIDFAAILAEVPYLSEMQRQFYRVYLDARRAALQKKKSLKLPL